MKQIPLTQGYVAIVDDADYEAVSAHKWCAKKRKRRVYAGRTINFPDGSRSSVYLHRILMPGALTVDHRDGNGLNNCRDNLRPAAHVQNLWGFQHKRRGTSSRFRGVSWGKAVGKWRASISVNGRQKHLGKFSSEEAAARAYDIAARRYFGEFASPNFPI